MSEELVKVVLEDISEETFRALEEKAQKKGVSVNDLVVQIIKEKLDKEEAGERKRKAPLPVRIELLLTDEQLAKLYKLGLETRSTPKEIFEKVLMKFIEEDCILREKA